MDEVSSKVKNVFLIDAIGGFLTGSFFTFSFYGFNEHFGFEKWMTGVCALIGFGLFTLSFKSFQKIPKNWSKKLKVLAVLNFAYCCLTLIYLAVFYHALTILGVSYLFLEIVIILALVRYEMKLVSSLK